MSLKFIQNQLYKFIEGLVLPKVMNIWSKMQVVCFTFICSFLPASVFLELQGSLAATVFFAFCFQETTVCHLSAGSKANRTLNILSATGFDFLLQATCFPDSFATLEIRELRILGDWQHWVSGSPVLNLAGPIQDNRVNLQDESLRSWRILLYFFRHLAVVLANKLSFTTCLFSFFGEMIKLQNLIWSQTNQSLVTQHRPENHINFCLLSLSRICLRSVALNLQENNSQMLYVIDNINFIFNRLIQDQIQILV